jgi:hypothetical protein
MQPAVTKCCVSRSWIIEIPLHRLSSANDDLSHVASRNVITCVVDEAKFDTRSRLSRSFK